MSEAAVQEHNATEREHHLYQISAQRLYYLLCARWAHDAEFSLCCLQVTSTNVDIAAVALKDDTPQYHLYSPTEVEEVISRL